MIPMVKSATTDMPEQHWMEDDATEQTPEQIHRTCIHCDACGRICWDVFGKVATPEALGCEFCQEYEEAR